MSQAQTQIKNPSNEFLNSVHEILFLLSSTMNFQNSRLGQKETKTKVINTYLVLKWKTFFLQILIKLHKLNSMLAARYITIHLTIISQVLRLGRTLV